MHNQDDDDTPLDDRDMLDDRELPDPVLSRCPYCKKMIAEDSEVCPKCGNYLSVEDSTEPQRFPIWFAMGLVLAILVIVFVWIW